MAQAPMPAPPLAGGMMGGDPSAGGDPTAGGDPGDGSDSSNVIVTICKTGDGSYMVYAGDEPDSGDDSDMSDDDADAMGPAGGAPAGGPGMAGGGMAGGAGQPADSIGAALKIALDLLNADKSSEGAPGNADDQLSAGFSASKSPTPASGPSQKY